MDFDFLQTFEPISIPLLFDFGANINEGVILNMRIYFRENFAHFEQHSIGDIARSVWQNVRAKETNNYVPIFFWDSASNDSYFA